MNQDKDILVELSELSPVLLKMKEEGRQPFRIPNAYFESLKIDVFNYIDSGLSESADRSSFKVPDNYFESLTGNIMDAIEVDEATETIASEARVVDLHVARRREAIPIRQWTTMAAAVALFILMGVLAARFIVGEDIDQSRMALTQDDVYEYLENNMMSLDNDDLFAMVDFSEEDISFDVVDDLEEELHQYLEDNIDDLEDYLLTVEI